MRKYEKIIKLYINSEKFWNLHENSEKLYEIILKVIFIRELPIKLIGVWLKSVLSDHN